jgi:hypothetical protein
VNGRDDVDDAAGRAAGSAPDPAGRPVRRRRHRRAVGGTAPQGPEPRAIRAADDTEQGWGARPDPDDDERILREKPPHW